MDESLNQSVTDKKPLKIIKHKKAKYMNLTIFLLLTHSICLYIQKHLEFQNLEKRDKAKLINHIFLVAEH